MAGEIKVSHPFNAWDDPSARILVKSREAVEECVSHAEFETAMNDNRHGNRNWERNETDSKCCGGIGMVTVQDKPSHEEHDYKTHKLEEKADARAMLNFEQLRESASVHVFDITRHFFTHQTNIGSGGCAHVHWLYGCHENIFLFYHKTIWVIVHFQSLAVIVHVWRIIYKI